MTRVIGATCRLTSIGHELACGQGTAASMLPEVAPRNSLQEQATCFNLLQSTGRHRQVHLAVRRRKRGMMPPLPCTSSGRHVVGALAMLCICPSQLSVYLLNGCPG